MSESELKFVGLSSLKPEEREIVTTAAVKGGEKLERWSSSIKEMVVHVKTPQRTESLKDKHHRFQVRVRVQCDLGIIEAEQMDTFDLAKAMHVVFEELFARFEHKTKR